jgi:hypothetical protein
MLKSLKSWKSEVRGWKQEVKIFGHVVTEEWALRR